MSSIAAKRRAVPFCRTGDDALADADGGRGIQKIIAASKTTGALNLSNRQLTEVPEAVFSLPENDDSVKWWEVRPAGGAPCMDACQPSGQPVMMHLVFCLAVQAVDLTKLDLSHNHITCLPAALWDLTALVTLLARCVGRPPWLVCHGTLQFLREFMFEQLQPV